MRGQSKIAGLVDSRCLPPAAAAGRSGSLTSVRAGTALFPARWTVLPTAGSTAPPVKAGEGVAHWVGLHHAQKPCSALKDQYPGINGDGVRWQTIAMANDAAAFAISLITTIFLIKND